MRKKSYPLENETLSIVTPPNETYNGKEITTVITTTAGEFDKSGQLINIQINTTTKIKKALNFAQIMTILKTMRYQIIQKL